MSIFNIFNFVKELKGDNNSSIEKSINDGKKGIKKRKHTKENNQMNLFSLYKSSEKKEESSLCKDHKENSLNDTSKKNNSNTSSIDNSSGNKIKVFDLFGGITTLEKKATKKITNAISSIKSCLDNYKITKRDKIEEGSLLEKAKKNIEAIKIIKLLQNENRSANDNEKKILVKYTGWGGIRKIFKEDNKGVWNKLHFELKSLLTEKEYGFARSSSLTAFYTPIDVIRGIYYLLEKIGFQGGRILDPSMGTGNFFGCLPSSMLENSSLVGIELDTITGTIAKELYPEAVIHVDGFENVSLKNNSFDLAISNIPFDDIQVFDKEYNKRMMIHDFFFTKAIDKVREGGLIAFVVSKGIMDRENSKIREYISEKANLLGAVRLPISTFTEIANIEITTDIIFLQKKGNNCNSIPTKWLEIKECSENKEIFINEYFKKHSLNMLGSMELISSQYGYKPVLKYNNSLDFPKFFSNVSKNFQQDVFENMENNYYQVDDNCILDILDVDDINLKDGEFINKNNKLYQVQNQKLVPSLNITGSNIEKAKEFINLKNSLKSLKKAQQNECSDKELKVLQNNMSTIYDSFISKWGHLDIKNNRSIFEEDPEYPLICCLEEKDNKGNYSKTDLFSNRFIKITKRVEKVETLEDALLVSINETGKIDFNRISNLINKTVKEVRDTLLKKSLIFLNPETSEFDTASKYLSGNVKLKLKKAKEALKLNHNFKYNVEALNKIQPQKVDAVDIKLSIGSIWIPLNIYKDFISNILDIEKEKVLLGYNPLNSSYSLDTNYVITHTKNYVEFGTLRMSAIKLIEHTLNLQTVTIYDTVYSEDYPDGKRVVNPEETQLVRSKQDLIKQSFNDWIFDDTSRREVLENVYNETFNCFVERNFEQEGKALTFPGMNPNIELRKHQRQAVARILFGENSTILAHEVGTGKTWTMQSAGMELRRLGLVNKCMFVIPNNLVESGQFSSEFLKLYPDAKILSATSKDLKKSNRRKLLCKIVTGDWDAIIIPHSTFGLIPIKPENELKFIEEKLSNLTDVLNELESNDVPYGMISQLKSKIKDQEKKKKNLESKLEENFSMHKDNTLYWEDLGIDMLFVDEGHNFKNLTIDTKLRVAGINTQEAKKAFDLYVKICNIKETFSKKNLVIATGTPVSNSICELYVMQKFAQEDLLIQKGFGTFDAWASTFGEIVNSIEVSPTGKGFRSKERFSKFHNVPELMQLFRQCADIVTADMVTLDRPFIRGGKPSVIICPSNDEIEEYVDSLVDRAEDIWKGNVKPDEDNMLLVTNEGRKLALDPRLVGLNVDYANSKVNTCIEKVFAEWKTGKHERLTQLIFCDQGTPGGKSFNIYKEIKTKLVKKGIPANEIAFIHEANTPEKRNQLFKNVREGFVRILLGSTSKMGEGMNVQDRISATHDLDCPWKPSQLEQRLGRSIRQGNKNKEVSVYRYVTKGTFDAYSWQLIESKAQAISQLFKGTYGSREIEDIDESVLSYQELKASSCDNPLMLEKFKVDSEIKKLQVLKMGYKRERYSLEDRLNKYTTNIPLITNFIEKLKKDMKLIQDHSTEDFSITIKNKLFTERRLAGEAILNIFDSILDLNTEFEIGKFKGLVLSITKEKSHFSDNDFQKIIKLKGNNTYSCEVYSSELGIIAKIENKINLEKLSTTLCKNESTLENYKNDKINLKNRLLVPFKEANRLKELLSRKSEIDSALNLNNSSSQIVERAN